MPSAALASPEDFNTQLAGRLQVANPRRKRVLGCAPAERVGADRQAMMALPPVPPTVGWADASRLPRDHYIRLDSNDYSVHPGVIGRRIEARADLVRVCVLSDGQVVADHPRCWARHQTLTNQSTQPPRRRCASSAPPCCAAAPNPR
ncbi:hypothetical protein FE374_03650 [Georgenia yuyongxinii]|uniref:Transposase for insertion sequence element IS21-like C-terminal domain-containing protein n=1 Tax=Georgenia yuyongxinii TaxID=2589797 RepID=A0A5B8C7E3_9MICO|nr:hypothetical protein FE374_03650 [Georgenia yuyongxinii]